MGYQFTAIFMFAAFQRTLFPQSLVSSKQEFVPDRHHSLNFPLQRVFLPLE